MLLDLDPTAPVPHPGADGRLQLRQALSISSTGLLFRLIGVTFFTVSGLLYWYTLLDGGALPPEWSTIPAKLAATACVAVPILTNLPLLVHLISPARLLIDSRGVTLFGFGPKQHLTWSAITGITTQVIIKKSGVLSRAPRSRTWTIITAGQARIAWPPVFGVAPEDLASYISRRQNQSGHRRKIDYIPRKQSAGQRGTGRMESIRNPAADAIGFGLIILSLLIIGAIGIYAHRHGLI